MKNTFKVLLGITLIALALLGVNLFTSSPIFGGSGSFDASGAISPAANDSRYVNVTGDTLTGGLAGTTAVFSGNVGIGTSVSSYILDLKGILRVQGNSANQYIEIVNTGAGGQAWLLMVGMDGSDAQGGFRLKHAGGLTPLVVSTMGLVGIGTLDPAYKLDVAGDIHLSGNMTGALGYFVENVEAKKSTDEVVNNSAALQNDDDLVLTGITADTTQHFHLSVGILQGNNATTDFDYALDFTNAGTIGLNCRMFEKTGMTFQRYDTDAEEVNMDLAADDEALLECDGMVYFSDTGAFQFKWAQEVATAIDTKVLIFSHIEIHKEP